MFRRLFMLTLGGLAAKTLVAADRAAAASFWSALKAGGYIILIRHAVTEPGIGDPPGFKAGDCTTQRNLSAKGRSDAQVIGQAFKAREIPVRKVLSSRWCRCIDTAQLAFGRVEPAAMLDSVFDRPETVRTEKVNAVLAYAAGGIGPGNLVFVTHAQNIQALTGVSPSPGELVVVALESPKTLKVVGRLEVQGI